MGELYRIACESLGNRDVLFGRIGDQVLATGSGEQRSAIARSEPISFQGDHRHTMPKRFGNAVSAAIRKSVEAYIDVGVDLEQRLPIDAGGQDETFRRHPKAAESLGQKPAAALVGHLHVLKMQARRRYLAQQFPPKLE